MGNLLCFRLVFFYTSFALLAVYFQKPYPQCGSKIGIFCSSPGIAKFPSKSSRWLVMLFMIQVCVLLSTVCAPGLDQSTSPHYLSCVVNGRRVQQPSWLFWAAHGLLLHTEFTLRNPIPSLDPFLVLSDCQSVYQMLQQIWRQCQL